MPAKKKPTPPASSRRNLWLRCRVTAEEAAAVIERIKALDPQSAQIEGAESADLQRVFGLPKNNSHFGRSGPGSAKSSPRRAMRGAPTTHSRPAFWGA